MNSLEENHSPWLVGFSEAPVAGAMPRMRLGSGAAGIERMEAMFSGRPFAPHRHDTYGIGITLKGVQSFRYRGELRHCIAGEGHVLHPDELHDGGAGTEEGFAYRIVYIDPALVQEALEGRALPFVENPVIRPEEMQPLLSCCFHDMNIPIDDFERLELTLTAARLLERHASVPKDRRKRLAFPQLCRVRDLIADDPLMRRSVGEFERISGLDRWTIARQFRAAFGTSPTQFRTMRQLDIARMWMRAGLPLVDVAVAAGFADQSHLIRMFKRTYGLTPSVWANAFA